MEWNQFGSELTRKQYYSIRAWIGYAIASTICIVVTILYSEYAVWRATAQQKEQTAALQPMQQSLDTAIAAKGALKKEVDLLEQQYGDIARIKQHTSNPCDALQALEHFFAGKATITDLAYQDGLMRITVATRADTALHAYLKQPSVQTGIAHLTFIAMETAQDGTVRMTFSLKL